jgi:hypothetical protein
VPCLVAVEQLDHISIAIATTVTITGTIVR